MSGAGLETVEETSIKLRNKVGIWVGLIQFMTAVNEDSVLVQTRTDDKSGICMYDVSILFTILSKQNLPCTVGAASDRLNLSRNIKPWTKKGYVTDKMKF